MVPLSLIIVADRGSLKAYTVKETPTRNPTLHLIADFNIRQARPRWSEHVIDLAGFEGVSDESGGPDLRLVSASLEHEREIQLRICKELAAQINKILKANPACSWAFAAPASIHGTIHSLLPRTTREWIVENVKADLVNTAPAKLQSHFHSLQPIPLNRRGPRRKPRRGLVGRAV